MTNGFSKRHAYGEIGLAETFKHPLAWNAKIWTAHTENGDQRLLVIITTMGLEKNHPRYKKNLIEKLSDAARDYVAERKLSGFMLVNRPRDWKD